MRWRDFLDLLQTGTFETILGQVKLENNLYKENWWVGQWQNGEFHGIAPATLPGAQQIMFPKPTWHVTDRPFFPGRTPLWWAIDESIDPADRVGRLTAPLMERSWALTTAEPV